MQCLAKDPSLRPDSAAEVLASLDTIATTPTPAPPSIGSTAPTAPTAVRSRRRRTVVEVAAAGLVMLLALAAWMVRDGRRATAATGPAVESLAVLPLANLSGDKADDYFGIGLAEEITRALAKNGVRVIGRVSAATLQAKGLDERAIAKELGVTSLLTGAVQRAGGQLRINMTLVSASDGAVRWTEKYDRPIANVFAVQDEIARTVAGTLLGSLRGSTNTSGPRAETSDPEAHALFLQGQLLFNRRGAPALRQAIALFEEASARDPRYARAQASLAMTLAVLPAYVQDSTTPLVTSAVAAAQRAIAMDSTIAESYTALGYAYALLGEVGKADSNFRRAIALDSTLATAWGWYGLLANRLGDYRAAHEYVRRALALEPASLVARAWEAQVLLLERRYAAGDSVTSVAIAMDSTFMLAWSWRANALIGMGKTAEAIALLEPKVAALSEGKPGELHGALAYAYARAGRAGDARALLENMRVRSGGQLPSKGAVASTLEELGDHEEAVAILAKAIAGHDVWVVQFPTLYSYDRLRKDPRVAAMLDRLTTR
jgi:serine/threonine-protein kinase